MKGGVLQLAALSDRVRAASCVYPTPHWRNQAVIPPMKGTVLQLATLSDVLSAASCDRPIEALPLALAESGPDSANGRGRRDVD